MSERADQQRNTPSGTTVSGSTPLSALGGAAEAALNRGRVDSPWRLASRRFFRHRLAAAGLVISILLILSAVFAPLLAPADPLRINVLVEVCLARNGWIHSRFR